jgi:hypothetical protein
VRRCERVYVTYSPAGGNVKTYSPKPGKFKSTRNNLVRSDVENNRRWLRKWAREKGALVVDIGGDPNKAPGDYGPFYGMERESLYNNWADQGVDVVQFDPGF